jgi:hypothetical protein
LEKALSHCLHTGIWSKDNLRSAIDLLRVRLGAGLPPLDVNNGNFDIALSREKYLP